MHVSEEKHERLSSSNADIRQIIYHLSSLEARNETYASLPSFSTVVYQNPMTSHRDRDAFMRVVLFEPGGSPPGSNKNHSDLKPVVGLSTPVADLQTMVLLHFWEADIELSYFEW